MNEPLRTRLLAAGLDAFAEYFRVVTDGGPADSSEYVRALKELAGARGAEARAWRGRVRACLGLPDAGTDLEAAVRASVPRARVWLAALRLGEGRYDEVKDLLGPEAEEPWGRFVRACAHLGAGKAAEAAADLKIVLSSQDDEQSAAAAGLWALSESAVGNTKRARVLLAAAARLKPKAAWPWVLLGRVERAAQDKAACFRALAAAIKREDSAWTRLERSRMHEALGDMDRALDDATAAIAHSPRSTAPLLWRAHVQTCRRHYHLAAPDYARALKLDASCVPARRGRAAIHLVRGYPAAALADARAAERASPGSPEAVLERARFQIYANDATPALDRETAAAVRGAKEIAWKAVFLRGCRLLKARRFGQAARVFAQSGLAPVPVEAALKSSFYGGIASGLDATKDLIPQRPASDRPRLLICGLGIVPPYTASLQSLRMILSCDYVFNNLSEPEIADLLWLLSSKGEPTMFDIRGADSRWTKTIFRRVKPGTTTGFVTRGHPQVCGGLAASLIEEGKLVGADVEVYPAVSSINTLAINALPGRLGSFWGLQVMDYSTVFEPQFRMDRRVPTIMYFNASVQLITAEEYARFCARLEDAVGRGRRIYFYGRNFSVAPDLVPVEAARGWYGRIDPSYTLLIPPS